MVKKEKTTITLERTKLEVISSQPDRLF